MGVDRTLRVLVLVAVAAGCKASSSETDGAVPDGEPIIMFQPFTSTTWSLAVNSGAAQLSITDGSGPAACALSADHQHSLGAAGVQLILQLPGTVTGPCPSGHYDVTPRCPASLGNAAYVPAGCAFYRQWDAQGKEVGIAVAINGTITFVGDATSCSIQASIGFLGGSFAETFTLRNGAGAQPWCGT
jgi:hypothetical protein